jgi:predicted dehydrogenase
MTIAPLPVAVVGLGGFAAVHHRCLLQLEQAGVVKVVATCDPRAAELIRAAPELRLAERGVAVLPDLEALLAAHGRNLKLVTLPTPVPLHAPMHQSCVQRGLAVYLEKPPTLDPDELERMIAVDAAARVPTWVGFNFIRDPIRQAIKRRVLAGEFGRLQAVRVFVSWQRNDAYYGRADWAGRLILRDRLVLDGPLGNAMAHYVHDALHWAGPAQDAWGQPQRVRASLLRAHRIQGADTVLAEVETGGPPVRIAVTHAGEEGSDPVETLVCERATIRVQPGGVERIRIIRPGRPDEVITETDPQHDLENMRAACALAAAGGGRPATTLADSRPFVQLNALAHLSTGRIGQEPACTGTIPGILAACERFLADGTHPDFAWAPRPAWVTPADLPRLRAAVDGLASA